ncbi:phage tail tape measure protein [Niallia alba]|uniref:phage tail tape measure protein n=1 Tax=Niallia alba TaxID=2729105 RepID=UPI002E1B79E5|nr:phage tail tape measure protein [Niallia alba]
MADRERDVVLNFRMDGQVQYAQTLKQINAVMNTAAKEYRNHIAAMGRDASETDKLRAEKRKLEIQMEGASKRTRLLRDEYERMANDTNTTTEELTKMYSKLLDAEKAENSLRTSLDRVNDGLSDQAIEARDAKNKMEDLKEENKLLDAEQKALLSSFRLQRSELGDNASEAEKLELAQKQLREQSELTDKVINNLEKQLEQAKKAYGENSIEVMQLETKLNDARTTLRNFSNQLDGVEDSSDDVGESLESLGNKLDLNNLMEATQMLQGVTDKLLDLGKAAFDVALQFGDSQTFLQANLGVTADRAEELNEIVESVFRNGVVSSVEEATEAVSLIEKSFEDLNDTELEKLTNSIVTIAKRTGTDVQENVIAAQKLMMEFGYSGEEAMDLIAYGYQNNLNKSGDFLDTINEYSPLFADAQFSGEQMLDAIKEGLDGGAMNADKAADAIKEMQIRFGDGSFKDKIDMFSKGTADLFGKWEKGEVTMTEVMNSIQKDIQKMDSSKQQEALTTLGTQFEDLGIRGTVSLLGIGDAMVDAAGKADEMSKKSPGEEWESSLRELQSSLVPIGQTLVDNITPVVDGLAQMGEWFEKLPGPVQNFIVVFGGIITVAAVLAPIILAVAGAVGTLEISLLPIIAIVLGVAAAIAGIIMVIKNWGEITDWIGEKWNQFTGWLSEGTSKLAEDFSKKFTDIKEGTLKKFNELKDGAVQKVTDLKNKATETIASFARNGIKKAVEMKTGFTNKVEELKSGAINKFNNLRDRAGEIMRATKDKILSPIHAARDAVGVAVKKMKSFFDFNWKLPSIKMPRFSVSGSKNPLDWLEQGVPKLSVKWNAKGGIFTRPTIFGQNNGQLQGAGEAGPEGVLPLNEETLGAIGRGIASTMGDSNKVLNVTLQVDGRTLARVTTPLINKELGNNGDRDRKAWGG